jgi:hypothetical protein
MTRGYASVGAAVAIALLASCGDEPTAAGPDSVAGKGAAAATAADVPATVSEILANPSAFLGQTVELQGSATERFASGELLFTDSTGSMPADFSAVGTSPELNTPILLEGTIVTGLVAGFSVKIAVLSWTGAAAFNCESIVDVSARFSDPGYVFGNVAGFYLRYYGVPPGEKTLTVSWDLHNPTGGVDVLPLGEGEPTGDGLLELEGIVSHEYAGITEPVTKEVQAVLTIEGREGGCTRVRDIDLTPGSGPGWAGGGTIEVTIDEGTTVLSGSTFAVRAKISNPTTLAVEVHLLFRTPEKSTTVEASGDGCQVLDDEFVDCLVSLVGGERVTRVVRYEAPLVTSTTAIDGSVALVTGGFAPLVPYRITVNP